MRVEVQNPRWMMDTTGAWVSFQVPTPVEARGICESMTQGERYTAEIKKFRKKRSKNACSNAPGAVFAAKLFRSAIRLLAPGTLYYIPSVS